MSIEIKNVSKRFKDVNALSDVTVTFGDNKIYALLGDNGAGKTTLLNIIAGRLFPNNGEVFVDGIDNADNDKALGKIFMMSEANMYPDDMKVNKAFKKAKLLNPKFDLNLAEKLSEKFGLKQNQKVKALSTGYSSIFRLIVALCSNVPYVLLDEPVLGLDAKHRDMFYKLLMENYAESPKTIIVSTHLISEIQNLIEHVVIIEEGKIIRDMSIDDILKESEESLGKLDLQNYFIKLETREEN